MKSVLVIDDCPDVRQLLSDLLLQSDYQVSSAESVKEAFELLSKDSYDLVICDLHLPFSMDKDHFDYGYSYEVGIRTIKELKWVSPNQPILAISATAPWDLIEVMKDIPEIPALSKPIGHRALLCKVRELLESQEAPNFAAQ